MTSTETAPVAVTPRGCRCGGAPGGCRCAAPAAEAAVTTGYELSRPVFFPGQLLAEADMDAVTAYLQTKLRLRNRYLFGAGVACGLVATPAGDAEVCVGAGYALDGCGNDVIVPVAQTVRVLDLVRDLRRGRRVGACDLPLPEPKGVDGEYDLLVRGHDTPAEFDSPYEVDAECSPQCYPTRMREGFAFELRYARPCRPDEPVCGENPDLAAPLKKMRGAATVLDAARAVRLRYDGVSKAVGQQKVDELKAAADAAVKAAVDAAAALASAEQSPDRAARRAARRGYLSAVLVALPHAARYRSRLTAAAGLQTWTTFWTGSGEARKVLAAGSLYPVGGRLDPAVAAVWVDLLDKPVESAQPPSFDAQALFVGEPITRAKGGRAADAIHAAATGLKNLTDFQLVALPPEVERSVEMLIEKLASTDTLQTTGLAELATTTRAAAEVVERAGLCLPLLPPCCPSDDPAVRVATVTVKEGKVADVCNLTRTVLHTPANLLYWREHRVRPFVRCDPRGCLGLAEALAEAANADAVAVQRWTGDPAALAQVISTAVKPRGGESAEPATPFEVAARALDARRRMALADLEARWAAVSGVTPADVLEAKRVFLRELLTARLGPEGVALLKDEKFDGLRIEHLSPKLAGDARGELQPLIALRAALPSDLAALVAENPTTGDGLKTAWLASAVLKWVDGKRPELAASGTYKAILL